MILCDIGNSFAHFFNGKNYWREDLKEFMSNYKNEEVYFINVNEKLKKELLSLKNWVDLEKYICFETPYIGMGIDRKVACLAVEDGIVVDAGSAITIDKMDQGIHKGGFIMPGFKETQESFKNISIRLSKKIDFNIDLTKIPQNTAQAVSYGAIKPVVLAIKDFSSDKKLYFTGGDGEKLSYFFENSTYDKYLIFKGMIKIIKEKL